MLRTAKKLTAILLCMLMLFSAFMPAASAVSAENYPVVYIAGYGANIFAEKGNINSEVYYPTGADVGAIVKEAIEPCLKELAKALVTDDFDNYCDALYNSIHPIYENLSLAPDGTPKDNSGRVENLEAPVFLEYNKFSAGEETFPYDWRLSPETSAAELDLFIDKMLADTGAEKVNVVARCLGGNVLSSYFQNYSENAQQKISKAVFLIPSTEGINVIGALFAGKINIAAEKFDTYVEELLKYKQIIEDDAAKEMLTVMITIFEQIKLLDLGVGALQKLIDEIKDNLVPRLIRRSYGSFPSFWAMVPHEYLEDALAFVYNTPELKEEYKGTIEKVRSYHDNVQLNARNCIKNLDGKIDIKVISKYNIPLLPVFEDCNATSDGTAETYLTSFGATTADFGKTLSESYLASVKEENKKYISPDEKVDASTCVLPQKTWFVKNNYHDNFPATVDAMMNTMFLTENMDITTDSRYPQFLEDVNNGEALVPVIGKDEEKPDSNSLLGILNTIKRFFTALVALIKGLFENAE